MFRNLKESFQGFKVVALGSLHQLEFTQEGKTSQGSLCSTSAPTRLSNSSSFKPSILLSTQFCASDETYLLNQSDLERICPIFLVLLLLNFLLEASHDLWGEEAYKTLLDYMSDGQYLLLNQRTSRFGECAIVVYVVFFFFRLRMLLFLVSTLSLFQLYLCILSAATVPIIDPHSRGEVDGCLQIYSEQ